MVAVYFSVLFIPNFIEYFVDCFLMRLKKIENICYNCSRGFYGGNDAIIFMFPFYKMKKKLPKVFVRIVFLIFFECFKKVHPHLVNFLFYFMVFVPVESFIIVFVMIFAILGNRKSTKTSIRIS